MLCCIYFTAIKKKMGRESYDHLIHNFIQILERKSICDISGTFVKEEGEITDKINCC